jgi:RNA polymerase sigma-70 factor (ECF subfamily)
MNARTDNLTKMKTEASGRRAAFEAILRDVEADLMRAARRLCGRQEDRAQDLAQEAIIKGYQAFIEGRFTPGTNARAWLLRILTNTYITEYNHKQKWDAGVDVETLTAGGEVGPESLQAHATDQPETALLNATLDEPLERALATLSPELRACVLLVDVEGAEYAEAAQVFQIPIGTVRSRLSRARMQLHDLLYRYAQERRRV